MAVTFRGATNWVIVTADTSVAPPVGTAVGDRKIVLAAWKAFGTTAQITVPAGWNEITEFADGSVASGAGTGSVKVGAWYKDHPGVEGQPTLDFSVNPTVAAVCMLGFIKTAGETWDVPLFATAAWPSSSSATVAASADVATVKDGSAVIALTGMRDDSATFTSAITDDGTPALTWTAAHADAPATHATSATGDDIAADSGYRLVTTGGSNVRLRNTHTLSAAETGAMLWIVQNTTAVAAGTARSFGGVVG